MTSKIIPGKRYYDRGKKESVSGLYYRVSPLGKGVWRFYYRNRQKVQRDITIGDFNLLSLTQARARAQQILTQVWNGQDPKGDWEGQRAEKTVDELFEATWKSHWSQKRYLVSGWANIARLNYENHIKKTFGKMRISEVGPPRIREWLRSKEDIPTTANRSLEVLSKLFTFAMEQEWLTSNPCRLVKAYPEKKRNRYATPQEIQTIGQLLSREYETDPRGVLFILLLAYTGARPRSLERAQRSELVCGEENGESFGVLTFDGKTTADSGEKEVIIFPTQALELLDRLPHPSDGSLIGCKFPTLLWNKVRQEAGCTDLWARDLRRTFATIGLSSGVGAGVMGELQNHKSAQTRQIYQKLLPHSRVQAATTVANKIEELMNET